MIGSSFSQASLIWFSTSPGDGAAWAGSRGARTTSTAAMTPHAVTRPVRQRLGRDRATVNGEGPLPTWFTDTAHPTLAMHHHPIQARYYYLGQKAHPHRNRSVLSRQWSATRGSEIGRASCRERV